MIIDSEMSFEEAVKGTKAPKDVILQMELLEVRYYGLDEVLHQGQIMVNKKIARDVKEIFEVILQEKFPINKAVPMSFYGWDDDLSMADNNSGSFCYRNIAGTNQISLHSFGMAIDINPLFNPSVYADGRSVPPAGAYDAGRPGTLLPESEVVKAFERRGFVWRGRNRGKYDDLHHFDKIG